MQHINHLILSKHILSHINQISLFVIKLTNQDYSHHPFGWHHQYKLMIKDEYSCINGYITSLRGAEMLHHLRERIVRQFDQNRLFSVI